MTSYITPHPAAQPQSSTNIAGRASLIVAFVIVLVSLVQQIVSYSLPLIMTDLDLAPSGVSVIFAAFGAVNGFLAVIGLILGVVGLTRVGQPHGAAGAGTAIAASTLLAVSVGLIAPAVLTALS